MNIQIPRDRFVQIIEREEDQPNDWRRKLEQSCIGRLILTIFCCSYYNSCFNDAPRRNWNDHRLYVINNRPARDTDEYVLWERAMERVNRNVPYWRRINIERPVVVQPRTQYYQSESVRRPLVNDQAYFVPQNNLGNASPVSVVEKRHPAPVLLDANPGFQGRNHVQQPRIVQQSQPMPFTPASSANVNHRPTSVIQQRVYQEPPRNVMQPQRQQQSHFGQQPQPSVNNRSGSVQPGTRRF